MYEYYPTFIIIIIRGGGDRIIYICTSTSKYIRVYYVLVFCTYNLYNTWYSYILFIYCFRKKI